MNPTKHEELYYNPSAFEPLFITDVLIQWQEKFLKEDYDTGEIFTKTENKLFQVVN